ncbi:ubiquinol oxidase subunit II [Hoeflea prorocentri]|uniref:Ubiquinol oxidase subunit 2 n=1 Tax=Hoeflea prorocentri TaxID=1922333 RepID=A0A9X3UHS3_9HYPH|nr:ubiquinol oxidase subunit II [Hoeflea prorocentri]MCY6380904.1 ubiquinol oxidase subunit II [Hoeflea prorocentri]MDA5398704.1 ubiquinol oxidase subunit II [Hoeflea prorocentri]
MEKATGTGLIRHLPVLLAAFLLSGCGLDTAPILNPKGPIAQAERDLLFTAIYVMMIVVIPVFILAFLFVWRYRASGGKGKYTPDWSYSAKIDALIWLVPALIVATLGYLLWTTTHKLDPYKQLASSEQAIEVHAIAQDWKWLFLYPEYGIASVNELAFPSERPLALKITSDTVMNSFMIPALGGQIYAMAGMTTRLHLIADEPGQFTGRNTMYSGNGFADQHFQTFAMTNEDFDTWVQKVRSGGTSLDAAAYAVLAEPSVAHSVEYYAQYKADLFETILAKYASRPAHTSQMADQ